MDSKSVFAKIMKSVEDMSNKEMGNLVADMYDDRDAPNRARAKILRSSWWGGINDWLNGMTVSETDAKQEDAEWEIAHMLMITLHVAANMECTRVYNMRCVEQRTLSKSELVQELGLMGIALLECMVPIFRDVANAKWEALQNASRKG